MNIWESVKTAWKAIFSNKLRSSLTMLGIVIGVCAVVLLVALGNGIPDQYAADIREHGSQRPLCVELDR